MSHHLQVGQMEQMEQLVDQQMGQLVDQQGIPQFLTRLVNMDFS